MARQARGKVDSERAIGGGGQILVRRTVYQNFKLVQKWCISFIAHIILCAGGQQPQVFVQIYAPVQNESDRVFRQSKHQGFCELSTYY